MRRDNNFGFITGLNECLTTGGGNTGKPCIFPFKFHGKKYHHCTWKKGEDKPWCSTKVTNGHHVGHEREWGFCNSHCPISPNPGKHESTIL